jgi:hypothetical protein
VGIVIAAHFDFAGPFTADGAVVCDSAHCGLIDKNGKFIARTWLPHRRLFPQHFSEGLSPAIEDGKWGYVDLERKVGSRVDLDNFNLALQLSWRFLREEAHNDGPRSQGS